VAKHKKKQTRAFFRARVRHRGRNGARGGRDLQPGVGRGTGGGARRFFTGFAMGGGGQVPAIGWS